MAEMMLTVRLSDMDRFRLFVWELRQLHDEMRVGASPYAERLEGLVDRFTTQIEEDRT